MVGKFLMALVEEFQQLCRMLSCQTVQTSPSHSIASCPDTRQDNVPEPVKSVSEVTVDLGMGNKTLKMPQLDGDPSLQQDHVLKILQEENTPLKDSNFSPYAPLPAIGKSSVDRPTGTRIMRQHTYRVLEPVYIKGPLDLCKFTSVNSAVIGENDTAVKKARSSLLNNNQTVKRRNKDKLAKTLENRKIQFSKSALGQNGPMPLCVLVSLD
ncbi:hypothetical protein J6590_032069 [Homalodisca vitripennis]|nr:hypothetical protein J6590_032069 [Homalodisca vitripennis]